MLCSYIQSNVTAYQNFKCSLVLAKLESSGRFAKFIPAKIYIYYNEIYMQ